MAAFAQGKIAFANNSLHLVYYAPSNGVRSADSALAGRGVSSALMPQGVTLVADLYAGTSSTTLTLHTSTTFSASVGGWTGANYADAALPGGTPAFFQVQIRDNAFATADAAFAGGSYSGKSIIFQSTPSSTIAFNSIVNHGNASFSTWTDGTFDMSGQTGIAGAQGAIMVSAPVPEPTSFALAGLALAGMTILRRRK